MNVHIWCFSNITNIECPCFRTPIHTYLRLYYRKWQQEMKGFCAIRAHQAWWATETNDNTHNRTSYKHYYNVIKCLRGFDADLSIFFRYCVVADYENSRMQSLCTLLSFWRAFLYGYFRAAIEMTWQYRNRKWKQI